MIYGDLGGEHVIPERSPSSFIHVIQNDAGRPYNCQECFAYD